MCALEHIARVVELLRSHMGFTLGRGWQLALPLAAAQVLQRIGPHMRLQGVDFGFRQRAEEVAQEL